MDDRERVSTLWDYEKEKMAQGFTLVAGVDEAGRGPLAGPVCVAAVILPTDVYLEGINDSKKLTEKKRERLFEEIQSCAVAYQIVLVEEREIDRINILHATFAGMRQAVEQLRPAPDFVLVDGNQSKGLQVPHQCVIKGDAKSISIAAASVLAKVTRDRYMTELDKKYPQYGFAVHKGYGTKAHYAALQKYGPCAAHRRSFNLKLEQPDQIRIGW